jgi:hypothetical protein
VRLSRRRRKLDIAPEVPVSDLGGAVHELSQAQTRPWPGGSREAWERFRREQLAATSVDAPQRETVMEQLG